MVAMSPQITRLRVCPRACLAGKITGVAADDVVRVAREFAENAENNARSFTDYRMGAGINHWYNNDACYRAIISLTKPLRLPGRCRWWLGPLCGPGKNFVRKAGWATVATGSDWMRAARRSQGTTFYYWAGNGFLAARASGHQGHEPGTNARCAAGPSCGLQCDCGTSWLDALLSAIQAKIRLIFAI